LPNVIKIDPYNLELYRFKVGAFFFETQCSVVTIGSRKTSDTKGHQRLSKKNLVICCIRSLSW